MSDREAALIRTILLTPGDDAPRLTYADWCDDNGRMERAEIIRVQIALAGMAWADDSISFAWGPAAEEYNQRIMSGRERRDWLRAREQELHGQIMAGEWSGMPEEICNIPPITWNFMRGFVESIKLPTNSFLRHAAAIFAAQPVTSVRLTDREPRNGSSHATGGFGLRWVHWNRIPEGDEIHPLYRGEEHWLPAQIYDLIEVPGPEFQKRFDTAKQAHAALSAACVSYGRQLAGLPPLEPNSETKRTIAGVRETAGK